MVKGKSIAGGVLNILGAIVTFISVLYLSICAMIADVVDTAVDTAGDIASSIVNEEPPELSVSSAFNNTTIVWVVGTIAFVVAICAAVFAFKHNIVGGILAAVSAVTLLVLSIVLGYWAILVIIAIALLAVGSLLTFLVKKPIEEKSASAIQQSVPPYPPQQPYPNQYSQAQQPIYPGQQYPPAQPPYAEQSNQPIQQQSVQSVQQNTSPTQRSDRTDDWTQNP